MKKNTAAFEDAAELKAEAADLLHRTQVLRQDVQDARYSAADTHLAARNLRERVSSARKQAQAKRQSRSKDK